MRTERLPHRCSYILVFNSRGELWVQKRTMIKDIYPGYWDPAAGGVMQVGESYEESALLKVSNLRRSKLFHGSFSSGVPADTGTQSCGELVTTTARFSSAT